MPTVSEIWDLLYKIDDLPYGASRSAMAEQLLRQADGAGDQELAFMSRLIATNSFGYGGDPAKAFVTFSWCLSDLDNNPQPYHQRTLGSLLWAYKAIVTALTNFPEVPLDRTYAALDDMERRYREYGQGMQAVYKKRYLIAEHVGLADAADQWFERWQAAPRDNLSDCVGCDPTAGAEYLSSRGRFADAVRHANPVLDGERTCAEQPQRMLTELMVPYLMIGRANDAADAHRRSYLLARDKIVNMMGIASHIEFCARTGNEHRGLEIFQRHVDWLDRAPSPAAEMDFAAAGGLLLRRITELGHGDAVIRRKDHDDATAADVATELRATAIALSGRFDDRNGTDRQSRRVAKRLDAEPYATGMTLSPIARAVSPVAPPPVAQPAVIIPAQADPAELIELAEAHQAADWHAAAAATLDALDARFPRLDDPLLAGRRAVLAGERLRAVDRDIDRVLTHWGEAADLYATAGDVGATSVIRARMAVERAYAGLTDEAFEPVRADADYQEEHGGAPERAKAWARLSILHYLNDELDEANAIADRSDAYAEQSGDERLIAMHAMLRARNRAAAHRHDEAMTAARQAYEFYRAHGPSRRVAEAANLFGHIVDDPAEKAELFGIVIASPAADLALPARLGRGTALMRLGRSDEAITDLVEGVALCAEHGQDGAGAYARAELANAYRLADRPAEGAEVAEQAVSIFERLGDQEAADNARYLLAGLNRAIGDANRALELYRELIERLADNPAGRGQIAEQAADLLYEMDRDAEAAETFAAAAVALRDAGDLIGELRALRRRIGALHYADAPDEGEEAAKVAAERFDALPSELAAEPNAIYQRSLVGYEVAGLLMARERFAEAIPHLRGALGKLRSIGATEQAERVESMLADAEARASIS
ncbi:tetratricopeptide repeat protein [Actinoplanes sp. TBRC 11911]|uniref:tetratricopeptide repeat protein n=1 Tax=Actinoplanes sp. TBRC 11911 TaxID=2729386 RepID=UPI00145EE5AA|nr:tetratricopeptide repeat protein [Actinoplanes sp. TBRC 11911]NMO56795.1 tetratricopeptide repeat protein [Actinoplanes sp. TBRC 11911]